MFAPKLYACGVPHAAITAELNYKNANKDNKQLRLMPKNSKNISNRNNITNAVHVNG